MIERLPAWVREDPRFRRVVVACACLAVAGYTGRLLVGVYLDTQEDVAEARSEAARAEGITREAYQVQQAELTALRDEVASLRGRVATLEGLDEASPADILRGHAAAAVETVERRRATVEAVQQIPLQRLDIGDDGAVRF